MTGGIPFPGPILIDADELLRRVVYSPAYSTEPARLHEGVPLLLGYHGLAVLLRTRWCPDPEVVVTTRALAVDGAAWRLDMLVIIANRVRLTGAAIYHPDRLVQGAQVLDLVEVDMATETRTRRGKVRHPHYALDVVKAQTVKLTR